MNLLKIYTVLYGILLIATISVISFLFIKQYTTVGVPGFNAPYTNNCNSIEVQCFGELIITENGFECR